ncbi:MAG: methyltransferase domain-containing protein [Schwartzia sp.]|nr:methyltransferase domain-containing protein [Schwartzia sp. (in: firmicutes)]
MDKNDSLALLTFLEPETRAASVLVIESVQYLPALRKLFPDASLYAVAADKEAAYAAETEGLGVHWETLDYRETVLPFPRKFFDIVLSERMLENVANPQDIASGIGTFLKDTGFLLTSFENIRYWRVLRELMDGHYYAIVRRRYAKPEFERLLYASFYKDIFFAPVRKPCVDSDTDRLMAAGFENRLGDLDTEAWMVQATRSSRDVAALKAEHTPELRKKLATLLRRIEYEIDTAESVAALWALVGEAGFTADYLARFVAEMVVHRERFLAVLSAASPEERRRDIGIIAVG